MRHVRRNYFLMVAVAMALLVAGCASEIIEAPAVEIMTDPNAPVTEAPGNYGVGTTSTWDHTLNGETVRVTATLVEKRQYKGREVNVNADSLPHRDPGYPCDGANGSMWDPVHDGWIACLKDGKILASVSPYHGRYHWPLEVGKSWRTKYFWTDRVVHPDWSGTGWQDWTVVAWEEVTVPAGTFMAYKVVRTRGNWETSTEDVDMVWYAPEIPLSIKGVWHRSPNDGYGGAEHMWELVSYDLK